MGIRHLEKLFKPSSIAVIGATTRKDAVGRIVLRNLLDCGFDGPIMPVNKNHQSVCGVLCYPSIADLPVCPDLAIICLPASGVPEVITALGELGTKTAIVMSESMSRAGTAGDRGYLAQMLAAAKPYNIRIVGPNSLGILVPGSNLNASFAPHHALPGKIAFVSQSGAVATTVLDWASAHGIGFSHFISLGDCAGISMGDVIDYLGSDPYTRSILLYVEAIDERRNLLSAARSAARNKPILVIKAGRYEEGAKAAASHTGVLAGSDLVYDSAIRRAGMLRVYGISELFAATETLARSKPFRGDRLAILSNGGGVGVLAVDDLIENGGHLAQFSEETIEKLREFLPEGSSVSNPLALRGSATPEEYARAYEILASDKQIDCILVMHAPTSTVNSLAAAEALAAAYKKKPKGLLSAWLGESSVHEARDHFAQNDIPSYTTPRIAIRAFMHMIEYARNQITLMETPSKTIDEFQPAKKLARRIVDTAIANNREWLSEVEAKSILLAYGIETVETHIVRDVDEAVAMGQKIGFPVVLKIASPDILHKSDVDGVALNLNSPEEITQAANLMLSRLRQSKPDAKVDGFTVQKMALRPGAQEVIIGVSTDPIFGPVILFGHGGTAVEIISDRAVGLPPLNTALAKDLISRTKISNLLKGYRNHKPADIDALSKNLIEVSEMIIDLPEIVELDINPLLCDHTGAIALDARIRLKPVTGDPHKRLAIRPYPAHLEEKFNLRDGREVLIRPIRPEDEPNHNEFMTHITPQDIRFRFFGTVKQLPHTEMARLTQLDYDREMAFIAEAINEEGHVETLGVVRTVTDPNNERAEYAILVRSDLKGQKLGWKLLTKMIEYCRSRGTDYFVGQILRDNRKMLDMVKSMGFKVQSVPDEDIMEVELELKSPN